MRRVGRTRATIEISFPHHFRRQSEPTRYAVDDLLDHQHSLRSAKSAECGVRRHIRLRHSTAELHGWNIVRIIQVKQRAIEHRLRQIQRPATI